MAKGVNLGKVVKKVPVAKVNKAQKNSNTNKKSTKTPKSTGASGTLGKAVVGTAIAGTYQVASGILSSVGKSNSTISESNDPGLLREATTEYVEYQYPLGEESKHTCWMVITAFKYIYDKKDIPGNRRVLDSELATQIKRLYTIRLPLPGDITTSFSANWSDYTSVWSKIVRASNIAEGENFDLEAFKNGLASLIGSGALQDSIAVGAMSGMAEWLTGTGIGSSTGTAIGDALTYLKVAGGFTVNPMSQASYKGHSINEHSFQIKMMPRNQAETLAISKIIELFENSAHGEKLGSIGGILLDYPDMFNIRFTGPKGEVIPGIIEIPDCHITQLNISRSNGTPGFRITKDNYPLNYILQITFRESQNLIRDDLKFLRQSSEQAQALHSGGTIPKQWDPNELIKNESPFDVALKSIESEANSIQSDTTEITPEEPAPEQQVPDNNPKGDKPSSNQKKIITDTINSSAQAYLAGQTHYYKTQGVSDPELHATKDLIKHLRNYKSDEFKAIARNVGSALKRNNGNINIGTTIGSQIVSDANALAGKYESVLAARRNTQVKLGIPGTSTSLEIKQGTIDDVKAIARSTIRMNPIELSSQAGRLIVNKAADVGIISQDTATTINGNINVFGTKTYGGK